MYVDDILITDSSEVLIQTLIAKLHNDFSLKRLARPNYFLGIEGKFCSNGSMFLTQSKYFKDILTRAKLKNVNGVYTPMLRNCKLSKHGTTHFFDPHRYRSIVVLYNK